jgi:hypothetical protein
MAQLSWWRLGKNPGGRAALLGLRGEG